MKDRLSCPKCGGSMRLGYMKGKDNYGNPPYVWAGTNDPPYQISGLPISRYEVLLYRCDKCYFVEMYAPPADEKH